MVGRSHSCRRKPTIPMDVLREVLVRLPAGSLLRLRWACKSFHSLTSHPSFLHRNAHRRPPALIIQPSSFLRLLRRRCPSAINLHRFDYDSTNGRLVHKELSPITAIGRDGGIVPLDLVSSCDGMLCLQRLHAAVLESVSSPYYICNPVTKDWTTTPVPSGGGILAGFYLHRPSREYRLLRHVMAPAGYEVLALGGGGAWRPIDNPFDAPFPLASRMLNLITCPQKRRNLLVHRSLHWAVDVEWVRVSIVAFDVESEKFRQIAPPEIPPWPGCTVGMWTVKADLIEVDGSLGLCCWNSLTGLDVWKLEDYGRERWCNMYAITVEGIPLPVPLVMLRFCPLFVRRGRELIAQLLGHGLIVYGDLERNPFPTSVCVVGCVESDGDAACVVYKESLVWYDSFRGFQGELA